MSPDSSTSTFFISWLILSLPARRLSKEQAPGAQIKVIFIYEYLILEAILVMLQHPTVWIVAFEVPPVKQWLTSFLLDSRANGYEEAGTCEQPNIYMGKAVVEMDLVKGLCWGQYHRYLCRHSISKKDKRLISRPPQQGSNSVRNCIKHEIPTP